MGVEAITSDLEALDQGLDEMFDRLDELKVDPVEELKFVARALPDEFVFHFDGDDLRKALGAWLDALPIRWQTDAYFAVTSAIWDHVDARQGSHD